MGNSLPTKIFPFTQTASHPKNQHTACQQAVGTRKPFQAAQASRPRLGSLKAEDTERVAALFRLAGLPDRPPIFAFERWLSHIRHDKKVQNGRMRFITLERLGQAVITNIDNEALLESSLKEFLPA